MPTFQTMNYAFLGAYMTPSMVIFICKMPESRLGKLASKSVDSWYTGFLIQEKKIHLWGKAYLCNVLIYRLCLVFISCVQAAFTTLWFAWAVRKDKQVYMHTNIHTCTFWKTVSRTRRTPTSSMVYKFKRWFACTHKCLQCTWTIPKKIMVSSTDHTTGSPTGLELKLAISCWATEYRWAIILLTNGHLYAPDKHLNLRDDNNQVHDWFYTLQKRN